MYRNRASSFSCHLFFEGFLSSRTGMCTSWFWWVGDNSIHGGIGCNQFALAAIPFCEDFCSGCGAQDTRMDETRKAHMGNVTGRAKYSFEIPNCFCPA